jgi:hypothetical protein
VLHDLSSIGQRWLARVANGVETGNGHFPVRWGAVAPEGSRDGNDFSSNLAERAQAAVGLGFALRAGMRNLGLALALVASVTAPHAARAPQDAAQPTRSPEPRPLRTEK